MIQMPEKVESEAGVIYKIIDEYRQRIGEALLIEMSHIRERAEQEANAIVAKANEESATIIARAKQEAAQITAQGTSESERIIAEVRKQAEQLIGEADDRIRKETRERTRRETERVIKAARDEADKIIVRARHTAAEEAKKENEQLLKANAELKQKLAREVEEARKIVHSEAEQIITSVRETAEREAEKESGIIIAEARKTAGQIIEEVREKAQREHDQLVEGSISEAKRKSEQEAAQIISEARQTADRIVAQATSKIHTELDESARLLVEVRQRLGQVMVTAEKEPKKPEARSEESVRAAPEEKRERAPARNIGLEAATAAGDNGNGRVYQGRLELFMAPPIDFKQMASFEKHLLKVPHLRLVGKGTFADGKTWAEVEITEPMPLLELLKGMPPVKEVVGSTKNIIVALRAAEAA